MSNENIVAWLPNEEFSNYLVSRKIIRSPPFRGEGWKPDTSTPNCPLWRIRRYPRKNVYDIFVS